MGINSFFRITCYAKSNQIKKKLHCFRKLKNGKKKIRHDKSAENQ
jgi:hypothetical protein